MTALLYGSFGIRHHSKRVLTLLCDCVERGGHVSARQKCRYIGRGKLGVRFSSSSSSSHTNLAIKNATFDPTSRYVTVTCSDGHAHSYPLAWLRDNCQCERCFNPNTLSRSFLMEDLNPDLTINSVKRDEQTNSVQIVWDDGHTSGFHMPWLLERSYDESAQKKRKSWYGIKAKLWDSTFQIPTDNFDRVMTDDRALFDWICHLGETGLFLMTHVPDENALIRLGERVAFLRKTSYGEIFRVESKQEPSNLAFTNKKLGLHTDLTYYKHQPGVQMLHCVEQPTTKGGENVFADGCHVAEQLRAESPEHFHILTQTLIDYVDEGTDFYTFHKLQQVPVIKLDVHGNVEGIAYNQQVRDSFMNIPLEKVQPFYKAFKHFNSLLYNPQNAVHRKLKSGEMICFNNMRVLHGRESYSVTSGERRLYLGGYLDWDELYSRMRVLRKQLQIDC